MKKLCDLHVHSVYSDGTSTPAELIRMAEKAGLAAVALCDHNTVDGLPHFAAAGQGSTVEAVPGIEFSTEFRGGEVHILALFLRPEDHGRVQEQVEKLMQRKHQSNRDLVENLRSAGIRLDYEQILAGTPGGQVNRAVIAAQMLAQGYCESIQDAFRQWLNPERGFYCPPKRLDAVETVRFIDSLGAVSVLAHPFLNFKDGSLEDFLTLAEKAGLDAMETQYSKFSPEQTLQAKQLASRFGLLESGGSDFHGGNKPDISLGSGRGDLAVDSDVFSRLKERFWVKNS